MRHTTKLEVVEKGSGDPVVFVHGSASDHRTWGAQLDHFGGRFRAIAYSRRYHWPNEPIPADADYAMAEHVTDLCELLTSLDLGAAHIVGHSYGAFVALLAAMREPRLVRTLVLAEPPAITLFVSNQPKPIEMLKLMVTRPRTAFAIMKFGAVGMGPATVAARRGDMEAAMRIFGTAVLGPRYYAALSPSRLEQVAANAIRAEFVGSGFPPVKDEDVRQLETPTLLLDAEDSPPLFHRLLDRLDDLLPHAARAKIDAASHIMHEDNPNTYNEIVGTFLSSR